MKKMICILIMTQISIACTATGYEPTKPLNKISQPEMPKTEPVEKCVHKFHQDQSLKEIAVTSGFMSVDCKLTLQQIAALAKATFELN